MVSLRRLRRMRDIVEWDLCTGCGACYAACDRNAVTLSDVVDRGIRPAFDDAKCGDCTECFSICPGSIVDARLHRKEDDNGSCGQIGPSVAVYEGYANDPDIRFSASSGGLISAIAAYCLDSGDVGEVWHTGSSAETPWVNVPRVSKTREEVVGNSGSRYSPSSPCVLFRNAPRDAKPALFIGKPCDVAAARALVKQRKDQSDRVGLMMSFCCAGTPSTKATLDVLRSLKVSPEDVSSLRYRGRGWPGEFTVCCDGTGKEHKLSYEDSWGRLSKQRPLRCICCPDGLGRLSDITCGDAWHKFSAETDTNLGLSIAIARTRQGRRVLEAASHAGYITLRPIGAEDVVLAQRYLLRKHQELLGRSFAMKLFAMPVTTYKGFDVWSAWMSLRARGMAHSIAGTLRRIVLRGLWRRRRLR